MTVTFQVNDIVELVTEIEKSDSIDWADLRVSESQAVSLIANNVFEQYHSDWSMMPPEDQTLSMLAMITYLVVENFTLNLKLCNKRNNHERP